MAGEGSRTRPALSPIAGAAVLEEVPSAEEVEQLAEAARQQRRAVDAIRPRSPEIG